MNPLKAWLCLVPVAFVLVACGNSGATSGDISLNSKDLNKDGCLNLGVLHERMLAFPAETPARELSTNIEIQSESGVSENFEQGLFKRSFVFHDGPASQMEFVQSLASVTQENCNEGSLNYSDGLNESFIVNSGRENHLEISIPQSNRKMAFDLRSDLRLEIQKTYFAMDACPNFNLAQVKESRLLVWGANAIAVVEIEMPLRLLQKLMAPVAEAPMALLLLPQTELVRVSSVDLKSLADAPVRQELLRCRLTRASDDEESGEVENESDTFPIF